MEPKLRLEELVRGAGTDDDGRRLVDFDVVDIGGSVEGVKNVQRWRRWELQGLGNLKKTIFALIWSRSFFEWLDFVVIYHKRKFIFIDYY